jgi:hypothetical protein
MPPSHFLSLSTAVNRPNYGEQLTPSPSLIAHVMWRRGSCYRGGSSSRGGSTFVGGSPSEEEGKKLIRSVGARKRAAYKWTNGVRPPLSLLPLAGGWEADLSSRWRARSPSFEDGVDWEGLVEAEPELV